MPTNARKFRLVAITKNKKNPAYVGARLGADRVAARHGCVAHALRARHARRRRRAARAARGRVRRAPRRRADRAGARHRPQRHLAARCRRTASPSSCFVSRPEEIACTCFVGSDDRALARGIADYLFDRLERGGNVVTLEGHPNSITTAAARGGLSRCGAARGQRQDRRTRAPGYFLRDGGYAGMARAAGGRAAHRRRPRRQRLHGAGCARCHAGDGAQDADRRGQRHAGRRAGHQGRRPAGLGLVRCHEDGVPGRRGGRPRAVGRDRCRPRSCCPSRWSTAPTATPGTCPTRSGRCRLGGLCAGVARPLPSGTGAPLTLQLKIVAPHKILLRRTIKLAIFEAPELREVHR